MWSRPSFVEDVGDRDRGAAVERGAAPGLYHCVNSGHATWYDLARDIAAVLGIERASRRRVRVADVPMRAARPQYCALSNAKLAAAGVPMPTWQDALRRHLQSITLTGG